MNNEACDGLLLDWLTNAIMDFENEAVLLITSSQVFYLEVMRETLKNIDSDISCHISYLSKIEEDTNSFKHSRPNLKIIQTDENNPAKNLIFFVDPHCVEKIQLLIKICRNDHKKILFCEAHEVNQVLNNILKVLASKDNHLQSKPLPTHSNYYLHEYASDLIKLVTTDDLKQNLSEITVHRIKFATSLFLYNIYKDEQIQKKIIEDIVLLQRTNLLTSYLAMHLYHLTFFTSGINDIDAGRYIREELGIKSKTFTANSKKLKKINYKPLKTFRAYDLSIDADKQKRMGIASKLIQFMISNPNQPLDKYTIAKSTDLSEKEVENMIDRFLQAT